MLTLCTAQSWQEKSEPSINDSYLSLYAEKSVAFHFIQSKFLSAEIRHLYHLLSTIFPALTFIAFFIDLRF
jgi:hypothetical protein